MANAQTVPIATGQWQPRVEFRPHFLFRGGHAQTLLAVFTAPRQAYQARQIPVPVSDGDQIVLHDDCPPDWQPGGLCVLLVHGLGGCHASPYMIRIAGKLAKRSVRVFRMDLRGCGAAARLAQKPGHAGRSADVHAALQTIATLCPDSPQIVVGFSLGANIVLKLLGESATLPTPELIRAMAVAPPIDLQTCCTNIQRFLRRPYDRWFVRMLLKLMRERQEYIPDLRRIDWSRPPRTLFEFDDLVTAPLSGFSGAAEYYAKSSARRGLSEIRVPTVILTSADDPVVPVNIFDQIPSSPHLAMHVTRRGGHVGFLGRAGCDPDRYWLDWRVVEFVVGH